ncbi:hypothetical protein [Cyanobium sp. Aljojuca 7D2]|uniref:hypothetical protein n=1 Tax=Cyanobium sp. Aljojuca 7D2 TaxID=2823698 RepID=UPI0020CF4303|nr:hypothetical protein [Cyanobium sp. Aljojuca 7D2]
MSIAVLRAAWPLAALSLAVLPLLASPAMAATPLASDAFVPFTPPAGSSLGGESLSGLGGAETFDPVARAQLLAREMPLNWSGRYQSFGQSQAVNAELRLASVTPMGQMIDLRGELTLGGVTTPVQGNLNAESDQLDLLMLCQCEVAGLEPGGVFTGLQGLQLSGWQAPRLTNPGGRLDLRPVSSSSAGSSGGMGRAAGAAVRGLW